MTRLLHALLVVLAALAVCAACQDQTLPWRYETDSIGFQYALGGGRDIEAPARFNSTPGATISYCPWDGCVDPTTHIGLLVDQGKAAHGVIELGTNDRYGGWTDDDVNAWIAALGQLPADSCWVVVLPWSTDPAQQPSFAPVRDWQRRVDAALDPVHTVDWRPYAERPGVIGPDGVHLAGPGGGPVTQNPDGSLNLDPRALDAYRDMLAAARAVCS